MRNRKTAEQLVRLARKLRAGRKVSKNVRAFTPDDVNMVKAGIAVVAKRKSEFNKVHKQIISEVDSLEKQIAVLEEQKKELEKKLGADYKAFDKEHGVTKAGKVAAEVLNRLQSTNDNVAQFLANLTSAEKAMIRESKSEKPSYKGAYETLVSLLNGTEWESYCKLIEGGFKKNVAEFESAAWETKICVKSFDKEYEEKYNERKEVWDERNPSNPLPKLKASRRGLRTAGLASIIEIIGGWMTKLFAKATAKLKNCVANFKGMILSITDFDKSLEKGIAAAKAVK